MKIKIKTAALLVAYLLFPFFSPIHAQLAPQKVIFDHDGGIDDLLSLILITQMEKVEVVGVCVTPADCFLEDATISSLKLLKLTGYDDCPVAMGNTRPVNPFPNEWRAQPMVANAFPQMLLTEEDTNQLSPLTATQFIIQQLEKSDQAVTFIITGPCSNLTTALTQQPHLVAKVKEVIWMGGAVDVRGNVATHKHNSTAEWNAYWLSLIHI